MAYNVSPFFTLCSSLITISVGGLGIWTVTVGLAGDGTVATGAGAWVFVGVWANMGNDKAQSANAVSTELRDAKIRWIIQQ